MGYASLARPLTTLLRGEDGCISKSALARKQNQLNDEAINSFAKIKSTLISNDVILQYPDFNKEFFLTMPQTRQKEHYFPQMTDQYQ